jgi:hypothetical protein
MKSIDNTNINAEVSLKGAKIWLEQSDDIPLTEEAMLYVQTAIAYALISIAESLLKPKVEMKNSDPSIAEIEVEK